ncbi:heavy-metal-associated domain-containing protein [Cryobacterium psychrophilum]|uniref:Cation transporter n=1 Tax=Cryobacterium psychrophilum TaxID=41988 RepID=A0A4Y8KR62_9MICO|nr:heavy-metal-associated domain-containing protein [Cryobacterium psychrophilum]TDW30499.1 copper chaperone CopZ [Cryobacterium psychrophilum]TFD76327.1 cation transporter [Cryobacterium psychrophilum]
MSIENTYLVTGMTCEHCVASVKEEIGFIAGTHDVSVKLVKGGSSLVTVTSESLPDPVAIAAAIEEAGYQLAPIAS